MLKVSMKLIEVPEELGIDDFDDIMEMVEVSKRDTINEMIRFIEKTRDSLASEDDKRTVNKLLYHIKDEFEES